VSLPSEQKMGELLFRGRHDFASLGRAALSLLGIAMWIVSVANTGTLPMPFDYGMPLPGRFHHERCDPGFAAGSVGVCFFIGELWCSRLVGRMRAGPALPWPALGASTRIDGPGLAAY
jgi:hypothetical protein